jgi:nitroreductase
VELTDAIARRHMTRNFSATPLGPDVVDGLLASALRAPSAGHTQGREFLVLEGPAETSAYWQATTDQSWRDGSRRFAGLSRAPVVILVFADPEAYVARYREPDKARTDGVEVEWVVPFWFVDAAFATMNLLLAATDRGVGAAFLGNFRGEDRLRSALGVPERLRWLGAVLLGEAAEPDPPSTSTARPRRTVEESVHRGRW